MKNSLICLKSILAKKAIAKRAKNLCIWYVVRSKMEIWHFGTHFVAKLLLIDYFLQRKNTFFSSPNKKKRKQRNFLFHRAHHRLIVASSHRRKRDFTLELAKGDEPGASERAHTRTTHYTWSHQAKIAQFAAVLSVANRKWKIRQKHAEIRHQSAGAFTVIPLRPNCAKFAAQPPKHNAGRDTLKGRDQIVRHSPFLTARIKLSVFFFTLRVHFP